MVDHGYGELGRLGCITDHFNRFCRTLCLSRLLRHRGANGLKECHLFSSLIECLSSWKRCHERPVLCFKVRVCDDLVQCGIKEKGAEKSCADKTERKRRNFCDPLAPINAILQLLLMTTRTTTIATAGRGHKKTHIADRIQIKGHFHPGAIYLSC